MGRYQGMRKHFNVSLRDGANGGRGNSWVDKNVSKNGRQDVSMLTEILDRNCGCGFIVSTNPVEIRLRVAEATRTTLSYGPCWNSR